MKAYVQANNGARTAEMRYEQAVIYAATLEYLGNDNVLVVVV